MWHEGSLHFGTIRTRCQRNTRGQKNPRSQAFGRYEVETTPKTVKSCVFFLKRIAHFCGIFALHMLFASWRGSDIKQRQRNVHPLTPFHPESPILEYIRCQMKSFHSCGRNAAITFGAVKWRLKTTYFIFEHPPTQPPFPPPPLAYTDRILKNLFSEGRHLRPSRC